MSCRTHRKSAKRLQANLRSARENKNNDYFSFLFKCLVLPVESTGNSSNHSTHKMPKNRGAEGKNVLEWWVIVIVTQTHTHRSDLIVGHRNKTTISTTLRSVFVHCSKKTLQATNIIHFAFRDMQFKYLFIDLAFLAVLLLSRSLRQRETEFSLLK